VAEQIISASGTQFGLIVNSDGSINIAGTVDINNISGSITIGSVSASVDSIFIQSGANITGSMFQIEAPPTSDIYNNPNFKFVYSGNSIGSVYQFIGTGSYVQTITYSGNAIISLSNWSIV
jgi:hypothetical protein